MATETTGASLVLATVTVKSWVALAPAVSVAVTLTLSAPTSSFRGVPENVWVAGSKVSQDGRALPSARVAAVGQAVAHVHIRKAGGWNSKAEACVFIGRLVGNGNRRGRRVIGVGDRDGEILESGRTCRIGGGDADAERAHIIIQWRAGECLGNRIEGKPGRQWTAIGKGCRKGEDIARVHIDEAGRRNREAETRIFIGRLIGDGDNNDRWVVQVDFRVLSFFTLGRKLFPLRSRCSGQLDGLSQLNVRCQDFAVKLGGETVVADQIRAS